MMQGYVVRKISRATRTSDVPSKKGIATRGSLRMAFLLARPRPAATSADRPPWTAPAAKLSVGLGALRRRLWSGPPPTDCMRSRDDVQTRFLLNNSDGHLQVCWSKSYQTRNPHLWNTNPDNGRTANSSYDRETLPTLIFESKSVTFSILEQIHVLVYGQCLSKRLSGSWPYQDCPFTAK